MTDLDRDPHGEAYERVKMGVNGLDSSGRPCVVNRRTQAMLEQAGRKIGHTFDILQASYMQNPAQESDHTHDGGGVVDLRTEDIPSGVGTRGALRALRETGFAAFHRTDPPFSQDHIHAVAIGDIQMDPTAKAQVDQYVNDFLDGLGHQDTGPRVRPVPVFDYDTQGMDMQLTDTLPGTDKTVGDALIAAIKAERVVDNLNQREAKRAKRLMERQRQLSQRVATVNRAIDDLPDGVTKQEVRSLLADIDATVQLVVQDPEDDGGGG